MTTVTQRRWLRPLSVGGIAFGISLIWCLAALEPADARPGRGGGGGGGRGGGARMNVGGGFNGPRTMPAPSRPSNIQRPAGPTQLPAPGTGVGQAPRPVPPIANVPAGGDRLRQPADGKPRPEQPICKPPNCVANPPNRPGRPPGYNPDYPDYYPPYWGYYPGYWPPPYPEYDDDYPAPPPPAQASTPGTIAGALPADCRDIAVAGNNYKLCGTTWYAPRFSGNQLVYVVVSPPT
jgi:hypothetical protein